MMIMNKKSDMSVGLMITFIIAVAILIVVFPFLQRSAGAFGRTISLEALKALDKTCQLNTKNAVDNGLELNDNNDRDSDQRLDVCDICVSCSKGASDNSKDDDADGMPNYCDESQNDATKFNCKKEMRLTEDKRCVDNSCPWK
ncbi:hypothetical protein HYX00_05540 [Candidatus Woesearchaeota archaeon]|nr:hypothetical protein [Candidatus Woesearchaeota archaeon]